MSVKQLTAMKPIDLTSYSIYSDTYIVGSYIGWSRIAARPLCLDGDSQVINDLFRHIIGADQCCPDSEYSSTTNRHKHSISGKVTRPYFPDSAEYKRKKWSAGPQVSVVIHSTESARVRFSFLSHVVITSQDDERGELRFQYRNLLSSTNKSRVVDLLRGNTNQIIRDGRRQSAVLVPMFTPIGRDSPELLFTLRSSKMELHKSQVCFPGGLVEDGDASLVDTALRETREELGIHQNQFSVWGCLPAMPNRYGEYNIVPVLASIEQLDLLNLKVNKNEVELVFHVSFEHLSNPHNHSYTIFNRPHLKFPLPVFHGGLLRIWGLTGLILDRVLSTVLPNELNYHSISDTGQQKNR